MKIISKYKDYYDYLAGVIGIDEKLILDRSEFFPTPSEISEGSVVRIHICGFVVECIYTRGNFYCGRACEMISSPPKPERYSWMNRDIEKSHYHIRYKDSLGSWKSAYVAMGPIMWKDTRIKNPNEALDCPILIEDSFGKLDYRGNTYSKFPILAHYNIGSVFSPDKVWNMLYDFLAKEKPIEDKRTDRQKIVGKGFDIKESFRHRK